MSAQHDHAPDRAPLPPGTPDPWPHGVVEGVARVLGDTERGLRSAEIRRLLADAAIPDPGAGFTKWRRLHAALDRVQRGDGSAARPAAVLVAAVTTCPAEPDVLAWRRGALDVALAPAGVRLDRDGRLIPR